MPSEAVTATCYPVLAAGRHWQAAWARVWDQEPLERGWRKSPSCDDKPLRIGQLVNPLADFSVVAGGPLNRFFVRIGLSGESLELVGRRTLVVALFAWLPLLALSITEGYAWSGVQQAFLLDVDVHVRLLIALPLLLAAEPHVHDRMRGSVTAFLDRGIVTEAARPQFDAALHSLRRLRESRLAELVLIVLVYAVGIGVVWRQVVSLDVEAWYRTGDAGTTQISIAGWWYALVSLPLFQFLIYRWYVRLAMWAWFLWKVSRADLSPVPAHPDKSGGLGFLSSLCYAFWPLLLAHGALISGVVWSGILFDDRTLVQYSFEIVIATTMVLLFIFVPLLVFVPTLVAAKRAGLKAYGLLAERYVRNFDRKWASSDAGSHDDLPLGTPDIRALADLSKAYDIVAGMRLVPINWGIAMQLAIVMLVPMAPLALTVLTDVELASMLLGLLF